MDIEYLLLLQNFREATNGVFNSFMSFITTYGEELLTMMLVAGIFWCLDKKHGMYMLLTWGCGSLLNGFLKVTACVYRPWIRDERIVPPDGAKTTATGYSFPSGHTTNATAVYGSFAVNKKGTKLFRILMLLMIALVGLSRNYLGVHTPQDVLVGCSVTFGVLFLIKYILSLVEKKPQLDVVVLIVGLVLNVAVILYATFKGYPMDYDEAGNLIVDPAKMALDTYKCCGFSSAVFISWFVDRRWLKYEIQGTGAEKATYYLAGIIGYFVLLEVLIPLLPANAIGSFLNRFLRLIYIMLLIPSIVKLYYAKKNKTERS